MESLKRSVSIVRSLSVARAPHISALALGVVVLSGWYWCAPPADFPSGSIVRVEKGMSAPEISTVLADAHVIAHPAALRTIFRVLGKSGSAQSGLYQFQEPQTVFTVARRIIDGEYGLPPVRLTFIEGVTVREMASQIADALPDISADGFMAQAQAEEGYLFPDTYFFQPGTDVASIVKVMRENFDTKIALLAGDSEASGRSLSELVILASLVEKEARSTEARRMVAGILLNRLDAGMPLQVDAVFGYIFNRPTYSPSYADLKVDSPYNTYTHRTLPPGPINNPGLDALMAVLHPIKTDYLYYLTGEDNQMHYATTYAGHQANQRKYLP